MISVCFFNNKGGVGKTTLTCNVASHFALALKKRVLLVDCDPQCNATQLTLDEEITDKLYSAKEGRGKTGTILDVLRPLQLGEASIDPSIVPIRSSANRFGIDVIPGHPRLSVLEDLLSQSWSDVAGGRIGGIRRSVWCAALCNSLSSKYDVAFFDIGPSLGSLNRTVLLGTQFFVSPMGADLFSIFGIKNIADWLRHWIEEYEIGLSRSEKSSPGELGEFNIPLVPEIKKGFAGYTVQQYIAKSTQGVRRPTKAYDKLLKNIPEVVETSLGEFYATKIKTDNVHLGDVPHMYSLVPLAQSVNAPIRELNSSDGLVGSQFKQAENYVQTLDLIAKNLSTNIGLGVKRVR